MKVFISHIQSPTICRRPIKERMDSLKLLGEQLQSQIQTDETMHVNRPEEVDLLCQLPWEGLNDFAKHYGMSVKCRARGAAFDFSRCSS